MLHFKVVPMFGNEISQFKNTQRSEHNLMHELLMSIIDRKLLDCLKVVNAEVWKYVDYNNAINKLCN